MTSRSSDPEPPVSIANAVIIYGLLPIALLYLTSFVDWTNPVLQRAGVFVQQHYEHPIVPAVQTRNNGEPLEVKASSQYLSGEQSERLDKIKSIKNEEASKTKHENNEKVEQARNAARNDRHHRRKEEKVKQGKPEAHDRHKKVQNDRLSVVKSLDDKINALGIDFQNDPEDFYKALAYADALRERDINVHDGGSIQAESIQTYHTAINLIKSKWYAMEEETRLLNQDGRRLDINQELYLPQKSKSIQGLLVGAYSNLAMQYYMANMFEQAVNMHDEALELEPNFMASLLYRADTLVILGKYDDAGAAYSRVLEIDQDSEIADVFSGISKVLVAKEDSFSGGWDKMVDLLGKLIPVNERKLKSILPADMASGTAQSKQQRQQAQIILMRNLKKMHLAMFSYHDHQSKDETLAWNHLSMAYKYKMATLPPFNAAQEDLKVDTIKKIFTHGFWPAGVGSDSKQPIFIIGFPRSGSTLLERVLDSHPLIAGTGEDSVFNGMLDQIRNALVNASTEGDPNAIQRVVQQYAKKVDTTTHSRYMEIQRNLNDQHFEDPVRFVDKMLTNVSNVGFIHMLYPHALILHVAREPMDTIFSAYKHEFPPGLLDYTCEFESLAKLYNQYRDLMEHWDKVLPGRVTHVKYEDMVHDMPRLAKSVIDSTGLDWDDDVLNFHKKKHAVNTLSTTQVRKGVYKDSLQSWKRYEHNLAPLREMIGTYAANTFQTTLDSYKKIRRD